MIRRSAVLSGLLATCALLLGATPSQAEPPRIALVIGNTAYTHLPLLESCRFTDGVVTATLRRAGFDVTEQTDLSNGRMSAVMGDFADAIAHDPNTTAVVYICGYATGLDRRAFVLPVSANLERPTDVLSQGILERQLAGLFTRIPLRAGLLLLDTRMLPTKDAPFDPAAIADAGRLGNWALIAAHSTGARPSGSSVLVDTLADRLAEPALDLRAFVERWQDETAAAPGLAAAAFGPDQPIWLTGAPPIARPTPAPITATAPPPPVPALAPVPAPALAPVPTPALTPAPAPPPPGTPAVLNEADKRRVQLALQRLGYYTGRVDGVYGASTTSAIRRYQQDSTMDPTGTLTTAQATTLLRDSH